MLPILSLKKEGNPAFVTTWMKLEGIVISEGSQARKDLHWTVSLRGEIVHENIN